MKVPFGIVFTTVVRTEGMRPALEPGDLLLTRRTRTPARLRRGEILVYRSAEHPRGAISRLIGLPGDRVALADGEITVNGERVYEPYAHRSREYRAAFAVPDDRYFVLGDRRGDPLGRHGWRESFVPGDHIVGVARMRLFPWPIAATGVLAR